MDISKEDPQARYEAEERWHQIVVSVHKRDKVLKNALRILAEEEGRSLSNQICTILANHMRHLGRY
jgi:hypothetical protein